MFLSDECCNDPLDDQPPPTAPYAAWQCVERGCGRWLVIPNKARWATSALPSPPGERMIAPATAPIHATVEQLAAQYAAAVLSARGAPSTTTWRRFQERARDAAESLYSLTGRAYWGSKLDYHMRALWETPR